MNGVAAGSGSVTPPKAATKSTPLWTPRTGAPLYRLLRRPAAYAWLPLAVFASMSSFVLLFLLYALLDVSVRSQHITGTLTLTLAALVGVLVGQSIKELQHCRFSWALPGLRARLLPGAVAIGLFVALFGRELAVAVIWPVAVLLTQDLESPLDFWGSFPPLSVGTVAFIFLAFWIGVRPSIVTVLALLAMLVLYTPVLLEVFADSVSMALATLPLAGYLMYKTFSVSAARQRPFMPTRTLTGVPWSRGTGSDRAGARAPQRSRPRRASRGAVWPSRPLGSSIARWIHAGWHENHGAMRWVALIAFFLVPVAAGALMIAMILTTMRNAPALWFTTGYGGLGMLPGSVDLSIVAITIASMVTGVPLALFCAVYGSIALRRVGLYPLSRRSRAAIEYWGSLAESFVIVGFVSAILMGLWMIMALGRFGARTFHEWPPQAGGEYGWTLIIMRAVAFLFIIAPLAQYFRLRYGRTPGGLSPVAQLLILFALAASLSVVGISLTLSSLATLARYPLVLHVAIFVTLAMMSQYLYRRAVDRHFARADLA